MALRAVKEPDHLRDVVGEELLQEMSSGKDGAEIKDLRASIKKH